MAALTAARDTVEISNGARHLVLPVKGNTTIYQGALVALDASGFAVPGSKAATLTAAGRAEETVENTGADGAVTIRVARGVFVYQNAADSGKLTAAHILKPCYIADDQTVTATATGASVAGLVVRVDGADVAVELGYGLTAAASPSE